MAGMQYVGNYDAEQQKKRRYDDALARWTLTMSLSGDDMDAMIEQYRNNSQGHRDYIDRMLATINDYDATNTVMELNPSRREAIDAEREKLEGMQPDAAAIRIVAAAEYIKRAKIDALEFAYRDKDGKRVEFDMTDDTDLMALQNRAYYKNPTANAAANVITAYGEMDINRQRAIMESMSVLSFDGKRHLTEKELMSEMSLQNRFNSSTQQNNDNKYGYITAFECAAELVNMDRVASRAPARIDETAVDKYLEELKAFDKSMSREDAAKALMTAQKNAKLMQSAAEQIKASQEQLAAKAGMATGMVGSAASIKQTATKVEYELNQAVKSDDKIRTKEACEAKKQSIFSKIAGNVKNLFTPKTTFQNGVSRDYSKSRNMSQPVADAQYGS